MSTRSRTSSNSQTIFPWRKRATYPVGANQRKRKKQLDQQMTMIYVVVGLAVIAGFAFMLINWNNAGNAKSVSCALFPEYCVPLAGGASNTAYAAFETADTRVMDQESKGAEGVVRGMTADNVPTIGNPDAPIHFRVVSNFACSHCNTYHINDLERFIDDYVITGQATLGFVVNTTSAAPAYAEVAAQTALCSGEQGAFWEMSDELYRLARTQGVSAFSLGQIGVSANDMGLDRNTLVQCVASGKYLPLLSQHQTFMQDNGITGTPSILVRYEGQTTWTRIDGSLRGYASIANLTEKANGTAQ